MSAIDHYELKLRHPGKPVDRAEILAVQRELGLTFPQPHIEFLLAGNGGSPSPAYLPYPGQATKVERFYSIGDNGLVQTCQRLREDHGLPADFLPIALLDDEESQLIVKCSGEDAGALYGWIELELGFRFEQKEYSNVRRLYFNIAELPLKFGPAANRKDRDGMFCQLYYASSNPTHGGKLATKYVDEGYDINFVLPTFRHPIFGAIDSEAFGVAVTLLALGTRTTHVDPQHENASVQDRLAEAQKHWHALLQVGRENSYDAGKDMATRRLSDIDSALAMIRGGTP